MKCNAFLLFLATLTFFAESLPLAAKDDDLVWEIKCLAVDANEGIDLADLNNDGKLDVIAGRSWYAAPDYTPRPVRIIEDWEGYVQSNGDFAYDVDEDGWIDVVAGSYLPTQVYWYQNPGAKGLRLGHLWKKHLLVDTKTSNNEGQLFQDLDNDGKPEWIVSSWEKPSPFHVWRFDNSKQTPQVSKEEHGEEKLQNTPTLKKFVVNPTGNGHGLGVGDINGDSLDDILCGTGWYECPGDKNRYEQEWPYHPDWPYAEFSLPVLIRDLDGDGRNDIIWGTAHAFGLQWWQQQAPDKQGKTHWKNHVIDDRFSQAHALAWADLDGDGKGELITGKRVLGHNGKDPGSEMAPSIFYYTWDSETLSFHRHVIDHGIVGIGLQIRTADLNGDGRTDIAVAGKGGTFLLINKE